MDKYFPAGYQSGLKKKYKKALIYAFLLIPVCALAAWFIGGIVIDTSAQEWKEYWFLVIPFALVGLLFALGVIVNLRNVLQVLAGFLRVTKYLETANDEELLNVCVSCYQDNNESLDGYMPFARGLLTQSKSN